MDFQFDVLRNTLTWWHFFSTDGPEGPERDYLAHVATDVDPSSYNPNNPGSGFSLELDDEMVTEVVEPCDLDFDGDCDSADLARLQFSFGSCVDRGNYLAPADSDHDGCITFKDLQALFPNYDNDGDGVVNSQDNCPFVGNTDQADGDLDLRGNACDCVPADQGAFQVPLEIRNVRWVSRSLLEWKSDVLSSGSSTVYTLVRGALGQFPVGTGLSETCLGAALPNTVASDLTMPVAGHGLWYLVRGRNACGNGTYGYRSNGIERVTAVCP